MSKNQYEAWMFNTYADFADIIKNEGINNVLQDMEDHHPATYEKLLKGIMERAKVNQEVPCLLLRTQDSSNGESQ